MDNSDTPKARRPLPTPGPPPAQRPSTPVLSSSPVPASSFYASQKPPPLPSRKQNPGSSLTSYVPPPAYNEPTTTDTSVDYREPELVPDDDDDMVPDLVPPDDQTWSDHVNANSWNVPVDDWSSNAPAWGPSTANNWGEKTTTSPGFDAMDYMSSSHVDQNLSVKISGRSAYEEDNWWDPEVRRRHGRPGPGMLPPVLAEELHDPNHSLYSVSVTNPSAAFSSHHSKEQSLNSAPQLSSSPSHSQQSSGEAPPSEEEVRTTVPHPNAYYCPKDNGWVILSWKSSAVAPSLAQSYVDVAGNPLPDQTRRRQTQSCIDDSEQPSGKANKTHHFHKYTKAFDSHKLIPPFRQDEWQSLESVKQRRRAATIVTGDLNINAITPEEVELLGSNNADPTEEEGILLDLYVCCQCSFYCVASGVISGVIPRKHIDELVRDKKGHPAVGKTGEQAVAMAFETFLTAIENKLWKGNNRQIKVASTGFQAKVGWNQNTKRIFEFLGFVEETVDRDVTLRPPSTDPSTPQGKLNRRKLLRAWLEINAWLADYKRVHASHFKDVKGFKLHVQLDNAREMYQTAIGAHPDQIPRGGISGTLLEVVRSAEKSWRGLGITPTTLSGDLLIFAYLAQCRCDPANTPKYFTYLTDIIKLLQEDKDACPPEVMTLVGLEQSRNRFALEDVSTAAITLGFGSENVLHVDYDDEIPDEFVENAWRECIKRSWRDPQNGSETHRLSNDAFRILAETRGSTRLRRAWEAGKNKYMNPDRAYDTLEIPKDVDDNMLITVYQMRLDETPMQLDKMREALTVIAEARDSERLRQFLSSGQDPGDILAPTRLDLPRGLNQLGNTCYLNSLLQYFYTIKDLREAVLPMSNLDIKALDDEKLTDEDLKRHRVGGRLVTRREIIRSRKFINQLANLFANLEYSETPAVTPTIELAKLALVTSRDEEEDEIDKGGTDSSNDTDATLVDDGTAVPQVSRSPERSSNSVLGKRPRDLERERSAMEVDSPLSSPKERDDYVMVQPQSGVQSPEPSKAEGSSSAVSAAGQDKKTGTTTAAQKNVPARKRTEVNDSTMMFGKQHDVAECMDNCMFQIETALLRFDDVGSDSDKTSVVKRLFYGKIRQRLTAADVQQSRSSVHDREDLFSHLPVNVTNDGIDIYDGLSGYFDDIVEFEGRKARMEVTLVDLPPLLQIQLQRVQFNRETLQPYKSQAYVKFGENLYMDRFLDTVDPVKKAQSKTIQTELNFCRDRVRLLIEGKELPFSACLEYAGNFLNKLKPQLQGIDEDVLKQIDQERGDINTEIDQLRARIDVLKNELETLWADSKEAAYELTSVFIHRGSSPSWGHYFFYSRHLPDSPDSWFKYNDSDVTVVSKEEVLADTTGSTANPYLLVFARKGSDVVDTVKRCVSSKSDNNQ
ncbi:hypothetical protein CVT26_002166 [Gymnopilus dilepis]|uniref:ubiquitinyl hydrolase 1 n=1 Tax=Gymnopilus dilepis TaxID=231916 RepID=A0A409VBD2_9AGAR|nr:hypothetical protein CVT26_002166 [Gymnopilus dilepis]